MAGEAPEAFWWAARRPWTATKGFGGPEGEIFVTIPERRPHFVVRSRLRRLCARFAEERYEPVRQFEGRTDELFQRGELSCYGVHNAQVRLVGVVFRPRS